MSRARDIANLLSTDSPLIDNAPDALNTLNELAAALGDDENFATTVTNSLAGKVSKSGDTITVTSASATPLVLKSASGQTANLLTVEDNGGTDLVVIKPNGHIETVRLITGGIVQTPEGATSSSLVLQASTFNTEGSAIALRGSSTGYNDHGMEFYSGNAESMRIDSSGNVGIGTTSPGALLDVDGDAEINSVTVGRGSGGVTTNTALGNLALSTNTTGANNVALGSYALLDNETGSDNTAVGRGALESNTTGANSVAVGRLALVANTTGSNTAVGFRSLLGNTTGTSNTAVGHDSLNLNTTGNSNTAVGFRALRKNTTGVNNIAVGYDAMRFNDTGNDNVGLGLNALANNDTGSSGVAVGREALRDNTTANNNVAVGRNALVVTTTGGNNAAVGHTALSANTTGFENTAIGQSAGSTNTTGHNNTFIGHNAQGASATADDTITLGDSAITTLRCQVTTITSLSDRRDKKNIQPIGAGLSFVEQLEPVAFDWNMRNGKKVDVPDMGFIAQDLLQVMENTGIEIPNLVSQENPDALEAGYGALIPVLVQAIKDLSEEVKELKEKVE